MEEKNLPKHCPLSSWVFPEDTETGTGCKVVFEIDKIDCSCCFPAYMLQNGKDSYCSCPEVRTDAPHYTDCNIFSQWFWMGKYQRRLENKNGNNKRNPIDSRLRHEVFKKDEYKCKECGTTNKEKILHCDHIIPVSQGGTDELDNLQTLCEDCNLAKSNKMFNGGNNGIHRTKNLC